MRREERMVPMTAEQASILEEVGVEMMRRNDDRAMKLLTLSLGYKFARPLKPTLPPNVHQIDRGGTEGEPSPRGAQHSLPRRHSSDDAVPPAGDRPSASVVLLPIDNYSRRVPRA